MSYEITIRGRAIRTETVAEARDIASQYHAATGVILGIGESRRKPTPRKRIRVRTHQRPMRG